MADRKTQLRPDSVRLIIFDWDGTLMDSETQIVHAMSGAIDDMELEKRTVDQCRNIIGLGLKEAVDALYPGRDAAFQQQFVEHYRHHWFSIAHTSELFPGAGETLRLLKESGFLLAVATGKGRAGLDKVLLNTGLENVFSATRCADETQSKPHPQMLSEILQELDTEPHQALMVGDTEYDLLMAINAGINSVAVSYGVHERERLMQHQPLVCLDNISELVDWLAEEGLVAQDLVSPPLAAAD
ncbi:MAG: HAD-IA family hydrolase [Gammaproteobacteria bacterium]|nr:MAG: HAD-IA family hydrolase [Gammaproteobacteria bacterium]